MLSQFYILSPRGDTIISKECASIGEKEKLHFCPQLAVPAWDTSTGLRHGLLAGVWPHWQIGVMS